MGRTVQVYGFPPTVTAEAVKEFLELYTGKGTIYALEIPRPKTINPNPRVFAVVQFTSAQYAELISSRINQSTRLYYGNSYLKVRDKERDIVPKPKVSMLDIKAPVLYFGCQVSDDRFSVLWRRKDVAVNFGFGFRKLFFIVSHSGVEYKLELSYDSIWQIQLRRPLRQNMQFLLIQVLAAPRIYEKSSGNLLNQYFMDGVDDQWIRTTDFSPSCCIGHSSAMCLELPYSCELPNFSANFPYYKEDKGRFVLESGSAFSPSSDLVPVVGPPQGLDLPFNILFKISSLVQNGCLAGPTINANFFRMVNPSLIPIGFIERALEKLYHLKECCYEPVKWLNEQYTKYQRSKHSPLSPAISLSSGLVYVRRVQVTPSKVFFCGPEINVSNRVVRHYSKYIDNFIRVSFVDENSEKIFATDLSARSPSTSTDVDRRHTKLYKRILSTLENGIVIGDKKFDFLAFSSSQLRESSAWMFASTGKITADYIREWMGDFRDIRNVAKYAARLGQSFGSSTETLNVDSHEIENIPDVEIESNGVRYLFSDGIGKISSEFAHRVARKCSIESTPSAFQIRYGGYKGVVAVDPSPTSQMKLSLRNSMRKFTSTNTKLDVLSWSKFQPCFLNRQVITLLSTLGVGDRVFEKKQKEAVDQLDMILTNPLKAQETLEIMSPGENTNVLKEMLLCGYKPDEEPFLAMMLQTFRASKLLELRIRSRIFVPKARSMMGCMDETRTLEYGEVFVQYSNRKHLNEDSHLYGGNESQIGAYVVVGKVVVAKNPCLHPGDMRVLKAVNIPALHHMVDCVVFPQKGKRPHPNECSGSDLDGDIYFVCWDPELIPPRQVQPMDYTAAPIVLLDHDVRIEEVQEYFTNYMVNDSLGVIANTHTAFADKSELMAESKECKELARLFSIAVDFPKTGVPAEIPSHLRVKEYPDFMEKLDKPTYESHRVIGKLFREVKDIAPHTSPVKTFTREVARKSYDPDMEVEGFEDYLEDAEYYKGEYDSKLGNLMDYFGIKTEAEILGGSIMKLSKSFNMRRDAEAIGVALRALKKEARTWFDEKHGNSDSEVDDKYAKASAWYHVTYHPDYWGCYNDDMKRAHFLSFPWLVYDKLIHIKRKSNRRNRSIKSLEHQFRNGLMLG